MGDSAELFLGALAGALGQVFTIPVSVIATRQQLDDKTQSLFGTTMEIIREEGVAGLWTGLKASLVLTVVSIFCYFVGFERRHVLIYSE